MNKELRNPQNVEKVQNCIETLETMKKDFISKGCSKREITILEIGKIILELENIKQLI